MSEMSATPLGVDRRHGTLAASVVILAGVSAALHVGKLSPALPVLREALGVTLIQAGFLLSLVQLAGMALGLAIGLAADGMGLKRSLVTGLLLLFGAGALGAYAHSATDLIVLRMLEGVGFLLVSMPAPSLIRHLVPPAGLSAMLGLWGTYMPLGAAAALLCGPWVMARVGWQGWWWSLAVLSALMAVCVAWLVPGPPAASAAAVAAGDAWPHRLRQTLSAPGPWLVALSFAVYAGQWLAVVGFLPTVYAQAGMVGSATALLTALVAAVNMVGNVVSGRLLGAGVPPQRLLRIGFTVMGLGTLAAYGVWPEASDGVSLPLGVRYSAVLLFSMVGGLIPGTLFSLAVRLAPSPGTVSTTVGWMQQWSATGQFVLPPLVAWLASRVGGWQWTWVVTGACSLLGLVLAGQVARRLNADAVR
jgi:CP family cyanate transporter-like MFS transporter